MSMGRKVMMILIVVGAITVNYLFLLAIFPAIQGMLAVASADPVLSGPAAGNFSLYKSAVNSAPIWLFIIPAVVGVIEAIIIMRLPEIIRAIRNK
jgi:hypothetical protein